MPALNLKEVIQAADALHQNARPVGKTDTHPSADDLQEQMHPRTQLNFSKVPVAIKAMFQERAESMGFRWPVHYLYHLMREAGHPVPDPEQFDGRGRQEENRNPKHPS